MRSAASATACTPDEQKRLIVMPATLFGKPASSSADARDVHALLGLRHRAADDHVVDRRGIEPGHLRERALQHVREHVVGPHVPEHAARRLADRRAGRGDDVGILDLFAMSSLRQVKE